MMQTGLSQPIFLNLNTDTNSNLKKQKISVEFTNKTSGQELISSHERGGKELGSTNKDN